jgi:D-glycero-alpha-D-manno-heptose 1-phosphate guanylyltransferase
MEAVILVGGLGSRLGDLTKETPKPMLPIRGVPFLDLLLRHLKKKGITRAILAVGYQRQKIEKYFKQGLDKWPNISFSIEANLLGTGGAILQALCLSSGSDVFVVNGDSFLEADYSAIYKKHLQNKSDITVASCLISSANRYGIIRSNNSGEIIDFLEKGLVSKGLINGGVYLLNRSKLISFLTLLEKESFSFESEVLKAKTLELKKYHFQSEGIFLDIGIPTDYYKAQIELFKDS